MLIPSITADASGTTLTDYLTGWGTIALAVVTVFTVLVTIRTVNTDRRRDDKRRTDEQERRQRAQARLVLIEPPPQVVPREEAEDRYDLYFTVSNHSQQPVMGLEAQVWTGAASPYDQPCTSKGKLKDHIVMPGDRGLKLKVIIESPVPGPSLSGWRVSWTDADGVKWHVQAKHSEPQTGPSPEI